MNIEVIGQRIDEIRKARKWSYMELARRMGDNISPQTVSNHIQTGKMNVAYLCKYAEALGCTVADLTDGAVNLEDFELTADITSYYPYNLAVAIFASDDVSRIYTPNLLKALDDERFGDRERKVIECRFKNGMTLEETGRVFGVTRERIREIEARALRKLRHPRLSRHYRLDTLEKYHDAEEEASRYRLECIRLKDKLEELGKIKELPEEYVQKIIETKERADNTIIDYMELSVRSYNCLKRGNINYISDLEGMTREKLAKVRKLGRKSMEEVIAKAREWGIEID